MTDQPEESDRSRDEIISGEYVLGVLSAEDRRRVEARIAVDRRFARQVQRWQANLAQFDEAYDEVKPPAALYNQVERRIFGLEEAGSPGLFASLWASVALWRGLTVASLAVAVALGALKASEFLTPDPGKPLVAELSSKDSPISLVATFDSTSGRLSVVPVALKAAEPKSLEVWLIEDGKDPMSLGILPDTGNGEILITAEMRKSFTEGKTIAITTEPYGGSPNGKPTGAIVALGKTRFL